MPHEKIRALKKIYNHGICGRNQNNETVIVDRLGNIKIHELSKFFEEDELAHYINQRMLHITERIIKEKEQIIWILDFTGKIMQLASKKMLDVLARIIRNLQTYFPELLQKSSIFYLGLSSLTLRCFSIQFGAKYLQEYPKILSIK